ncbi:MAG: hypothetical protein ACRC2O_10480, partial [Chitinophagaceae bacterium]
LLTRLISYGFEQISPARFVFDTSGIINSSGGITTGASSLLHPIAKIKEKRNNVENRVACFIYSFQFGYDKNDYLRLLSGNSRIGGENFRRYQIGGITQI